LKGLGAKHLHEKDLESESESELSELSSMLSSDTNEFHKENITNVEDNEGTILYDENGNLRMVYKVLIGITIIVIIGGVIYYYSDSAGGSGSTGGSGGSGGNSRTNESFVKR
jgi:hypothetical protein